ncbi:MAG: insulinase family protein [Lentisphaeria bacterium]
MRKIILLFLLLSGASVSMQAGDWPHSNSDLPPDPKVQWGRLDNGVRFAVRPHREPPGRVTLRLLVKAGSLMETEKETGLAHFIEHMAFNGTENFEADEMVKYFQRLGMAFGADTNASTGFDRTVYQLELPNNKDEMIDKGLLLLRDYAGRLKLAEKQIDKERGVILSEMRTRNTVRYRTSKAHLAFVLPESIIPRRFPIGTREVIENASRSRFVGFYNKWYIPPRIYVVAVGDKDPQRLRDMIAKHFSSMKPAEKLPGSGDFGKVAPRGMDTGYHYESDAPNTSVSIETYAPYSRGGDSRSQRLESLQRNLVYSILQRRLEILSREQESPFSKAQVMAYDWLDFVSASGIELTCDPADWQPALRVTETELRRALKYGFTTGELEYQVSQSLKRYRRAAETAATRRSREIAQGIVYSLQAGDVYTTPEADLELAEEALQDLSTDEALRVLRKFWNLSDSRYVFVSGNAEIDNPQQAIPQAYDASREKEVKPPREREFDKFAYTDFGKPGSVKRQSRNEKLEVTRLTFDNNLHVNLKKTDFEADTIRIGIRFGGGKLDVPKKQAGLMTLAGRTFIKGGLEKHSYSDLENFFADKDVGVNFAVDNAAFVLSGTTTPEDLLLQFQLMAAYLQAPGYRQEALVQARKTLPDFYRRLKHTPGGVFQDKISNFLSSGDPRFGVPPQNEVMKLDMNDVRDWLDAPLRESMLEISVVGDFEQEKVLNALRKTIGALPVRRGQKSKYTKARIVEFPRRAEDKTLRYQNQEKKALALVTWPTTDGLNIKRARRLNVLSRVINDRLRIEIREEVGESYSPSAFSYTSQPFKEYGYLAAFIMTSPENAANVARLTRKLAVDLQKNGATADEVERAVQPLVNSIKEQRRNNSYWLNTVLMGSTERPERLKWAETIVKDYASINPKDVNKLARQYLAEGKALTLLVQPY